MQHKLTIPGRLDALNEYTSANRRNPYEGSKMKRQNEEVIVWNIRQQLRGIHIKNKVIIHYKFYEIDKRRDKDNILSCAMKFVQDSLVKCGILGGDGWNYIENFTHEFFVDHKHPRIEIMIEELEGSE